MTTEGGGGPKLPEKGGPDFPLLASHRRVPSQHPGPSELGRDTAEAGRNAATERVEGLQRLSDDQVGQIKVLMEFVRGALDDRIEGRIRRALDERERTKDRDG